MTRRLLVLVLALLLAVGTTDLAVAQSDGPPVSVVHVVKRGETLFSIAQMYGTTVDAITHTNGISDPRQIFVGQRIIIPGVAGVAGEVGAMAMVPYVVRAGDTLTSIARRTQTTWQTLVYANRLLSPNSIYVGQVVRVPQPGAPGDSAEPAGAFAAGGQVYVVRPDDTPFRIALRYDVSLWALADASRISSLSLVYPGQELIIPGESASVLPEPFLSIDVWPLPVAQGTTMVVAVSTTGPASLGGTLLAGPLGQELYFAEEDGVQVALVGLHVFTEVGLYDLELRAVDDAGQMTVVSTGIVVSEGGFGYERIDLPESRLDLLDPDLTRDELAYLRSRQVFTPVRQWTTPFLPPCVGTVSAYFGTFRAYGDGPYNSYHTGVDFKAPHSTPVYAPVAGTVVLAELLTVRGNTIILDHGWGVMTGYWHLSAIEVRVGEQVAAGDLIGRVGNTGLSTGAHLHWETWVNGTSVNGRQWLEGAVGWPGDGQSEAGDARAGAGGDD